MTTGYDKISIDHQILLDLPYREATGIITMDRAKPNRHIDLVNTPTWASIASGLGVLDFDAASNEYGECDVLDTLDLDFTTDDYSIVCWVNWCDTGISELIVGRYETNVDGWDIYLTSMALDTLSQRHHHSSLAQLTDSCYSVGWTPDTGLWTLLGVTRSGLWPLHYRNAVALTMAYSAFGFRSPDTCNQDLVIGTRGVTKNTNFYDGMMQGLRIWDRELSAAEMMFIFERERKWFGV
jgi:hypothetical protein